MSKTSGFLGRQTARLKFGHSIGSIILWALLTTVTVCNYLNLHPVYVPILFPFGLLMVWVIGFIQQKYKIQEEDIALQIEQNIKGVRRNNLIYWSDIIFLVAKMYREGYLFSKDTDADDEEFIKALRDISTEILNRDHILIKEESKKEVL